jgi:hypothetical protein
MLSTSEAIWARNQHRRKADYFVESLGPGWAGASQGGLSSRELEKSRSVELRLAALLFILPSRVRRHFMRDGSMRIQRDRCSK